MNHNFIIVINAINIFPVILVSSAMKMILGQTFKISLTYSTIVSYAGIIGIFKFLMVNFVNNRSLISCKFSNYQQWAFVGSSIMTIFLILIYGLLTFCHWNPKTLALSVTILSTFVLLGDIINETAISIFYSKYKDKSIASSIFLGHKIAALLGYFLFPMVVEYIGFHLSFISFIIISLGVNFSIFFLPPTENKNQESQNIIPLIIKDLQNIKNIYGVFAFIITCQLGSLIVSGMKCNFIAQVTKQKFLSYLLRGLGLLVGLISGIFNNKLKKIIKQDNDFFIIGGILHLIAIIINFWAFYTQSPRAFIISTIFENINKGFMMASLTKFFLNQSHNKPHILTFFWGFFSLLRSVYGGMSGFLMESLGINQLFFGLIITSIIPIIISFFLKYNNN